IDARLQCLAGGRHRQRAAREERADVAEEGQTVAGQIPLVEDIAGGAYRHLQAGERLLAVGLGADAGHGGRSEEHTSELQSLMRISYAVFCLKKKTSKRK